MGIIFDTTAILTIERSHESLDALIAGRREEFFGISIVTTAELLHGVERADTEERKLRRLATAGQNHGKQNRKRRRVCYPADAVVSAA